MQQISLYLHASVRNPFIAINPSTSNMQWPLCLFGLLRCEQGTFRVWGASAVGHSVLLRLYGFQAHFWVAAPLRQVQQRGMLPASQTFDPWRLLIGLPWRLLIGLLCSTHGRPVTGADVQLLLYYLQLYI